MARPKSDRKRLDLLIAASRVIDAEGLGASTASIAKEAGVAGGTLFTYFATKADLLNALYVELKREMAKAALEGVSSSSDPKGQFRRIWTNWTRWAIAYRERRRTLALLATCDEVSPESRKLAADAMEPIGTLLERIKEVGPANNVSFEFIAAITDSIAGTTMDFMVNDPQNAETHCAAGFASLWRVLGGSD